MGKKDESQSALERCFYAFLQYRKEKLILAQRQQAIFEAQFNRYLYYKTIGNLIFRYILVHNYIDEKPQSVLEIMDDSAFSCNSVNMLHYKWGYRGTTRERFEHSLQSYLGTELGRSCLVKCTEKNILISFNS